MTNFVEIRPRELSPALLELDGISRTTIEALAGDLRHVLAPAPPAPSPLRRVAASHEKE